jgi:hypothetical protein
MKELAPDAELIDSYICYNCEHLIMWQFTVCLVISNAALSDEGSYVCYATNSIGTGSSQQTFLDVIGSKWCVYVLLLVVDNAPPINWCYRWGSNNGASKCDCCTNVCIIIWQSYGDRGYICKIRYMYIYFQLKSKKFNISSLDTG